MKKFLYAALAATTLFATPAFAQNTAGVTDSDDTVITANIPNVCELTAPADVTLASFLGNGTGGSIGNVNILCNDPDGFTFTATSANPSGAPVEGSSGGLLVPTDSSADSSIAYRVVTNGQALFGAPKQAGDLTANAGDFVGGKDIDIAFVSNGVRNLAGTGPGLPYAGIYQDTVTFTVVSN
jgi:hypothetical protein